MIRFTALVLAVFICLFVMTAPPAQAGQADEILLGFVYGTSFGLLFSGTMLIFYTNPDSDMNIETVLITGGLIGATGGIIFGALLPDNAVERDPIVSMKKKGGEAWTVSLDVPTPSVSLLDAAHGTRWGVATQLFRLDF